MPEETIVTIDGKPWVAREPVPYRLQPDTPVALMVGQNTHADTQGLLEYPVELGGLMALWEQRLAEERKGYWSNQAGIMLNDGALELGPAIATTTPAAMLVGADPACSFCVSDIDGTRKLYVAWGDRVFKAAAASFTQVAQVANAKGLSLIETRGDGYRRCLMWACGLNADIQVSYNGTSFSAPWTGERAELVFNHEYSFFGGAPGRTSTAVRLLGGVLARLRRDMRNATLIGGWDNSDMSLETWLGWSPSRYIGYLASADPSPRPGASLPTGASWLTLLGGVGVIGVNLLGYGTAHGPGRTPIGGGKLSAILFPETLAIGGIVAGCAYKERFALCNGKSPIYLWSPNQEPVAIGPFAQDGVPSDWTGYLIRDLVADGDHLLALVEKGTGLYIWRYDGKGTWDVPVVAQTGSYPGGGRPMCVIRAGMGGSIAAGTEEELLPTADGSVSVWVSVGGNSAADCVDDDPPDDDQSYIQNSLASPSAHLFVLSDMTLPAGQTIRAVRVEALVRRAGEGSRTASVGLRIKSGATTVTSPYFDNLGIVEPAQSGNIYDGTAVGRGRISYDAITYSWLTDPNTSAAWTAAGVNALEAGVVTTGLTAGKVRCTWLRVYVVYAPAASAQSFTSRLWYGAAHASTPALAYVDLPEHGWNLRGTTINRVTGATARRLYTAHLGLNRPERQKVFYGVRLHGEFTATHKLNLDYILDKGSLAGANLEATADGAFLRFGAGNAGVKGYTIQLALAPLGGGTTTGPVLIHKGAVLEYNEVRDQRWLIGPVILDLHRTAEHRRGIEPEKLFEELEALVAQGTLFVFKYADRPDKLVIVTYPSGANLTEEFLEVKGDLVSLWLVEPVPA